MAESLTPGARARARKHYDAFNMFNASSFVILSGSMVTLFALKLGASASQVGLLNAMTYVSFFFMPLGKRLVMSQPIVTVYFWGWLFRYLLMVPVLAAPLLVASGQAGVAFTVLLAGTAGFNIARGIGMIGNNPVLAHLAEGGDRGAFISRIQIFGNLAALATNLAVSLVLGRSAGTLVYSVLIGVGIAIGVAGVFSLRRLPEPSAYRPEKGSGIWRTFREAMREPPYRTFMAIYLLLIFTAGMGRSFLPVYAKTVYGEGDDFVMILTFVSSIAGVVVGLLSRLVLDRLGAKPLFAIYTFIAILGFVPAMVSPSLVSGALSAVLLIALFFISAFGMAGQDSAGQTYYFGIVPRERTLDLAVAYFLANGIGGTLGSLSGGLVLEGFQLLGLDTGTSWRLFYGIVGVLLVVAMLMMGKLVRLGSASIRESLGSLFSIRDLRAFDILTRLDSSEDPKEELDLIHQLGMSGSPRSQRDLVGYLSSPRFELRTEALHSLEALPELDAATVAALVAEIGNRADTTGYIAARILGKRGAREALPPLRAALSGSDPLLRGAAAVALARLDDRESVGAIEELLRSHSPPRLRLQTAYALELFGSLTSIPTLVASLWRDDPPAFLSDELVLAMASILGLMDDLYPLYQAFSEDEERGLSLLRLSAAERIGDRGALADFEGALLALFGDPGDGAPFARLLMGARLDPSTALVFSDALFDPNLGYRGFRFLVAGALVFGERVEA
ncbi:MAG: MFS transporter [Spirochaetota bacterium]